MSGGVVVICCWCGWNRIHPEPWPVLSPKSALFFLRPRLLIFLQINLFATFSPHSQLNRIFYFPLLLQIKGPRIDFSQNFAKLHPGPKVPQTQDCKSPIQYFVKFRGGGYETLLKEHTICNCHSLICTIFLKLTNSLSVTIKRFDSCCIQKAKQAVKK